MRRRVLIAATMLFFAACDGSDDASDHEAETAPPQNALKADSKSIVGLFETHASTHQNGDITVLSLNAAGAKPGSTDLFYVRERCYHAACALPLPETDKYDMYSSTTGKTYVRFWSFAVVNDPKAGRGSAPQIADVYEIKRTSTGIKLRRSATTRWTTLYSTTVAKSCTESGGTWSAGACTCDGNTPGQPAAIIFVPGAGGCVANPGASESNCDDSLGLWTDDDATLTGAYCVCGVGRYDDASGSCVNI